MQDDGGCLRHARLKPRYVKVAVGGFVDQCNPFDTASLHRGFNGGDKGGCIYVGIARDEKNVRTRHANRTTHFELGSITGYSICQCDLNADRKAVHAW